jgi:hypothetical protein
MSDGREHHGRSWPFPESRGSDAREVADRHQQAIDQRQAGVLTSRCGQVLPQPGLDHLQVGSLTGEGGSMDSEQAGKMVAEAAAEIGIKLPVGIDVQELANHFNGQNFAVGQPRRGTALAQLGTGLAKEVVDGAEDGYDEVLEVHGRLLWQQTGVAGCSLLQDSRGSRDPENLHIGLDTSRLHYSSMRPIF